MAKNCAGAFANLSDTRIAVVAPFLGRQPQAEQCLIGPLKRQIVDDDLKRAILDDPCDGDNLAEYVAPPPAVAGSSGQSRRVQHDTAKRKNLCCPVESVVV